MKVLAVTNMWPTEADRACGVFVRERYNQPLAVATLIVYCGLCVLILAPEIRRGLFDRLSLPGGERRAGA